MNARRAACCSFILILVLTPQIAGPWGTLAGTIDPGWINTFVARRLVGNLSPANSGLFDELTARQGPHPIHQFVVAQAYGILREDPAYADGKSGLPTLADINSWDGNVHTASGMMQRPPGVMTSRPMLAPYSDRAYGPGADAEIIPDGTYNQEYRGALHYWNPWLENGEAPEGAAIYYTKLVDAIINEGSFNERAHYASYMSHYIADVASAKHADAVTFDPDAIGPDGLTDLEALSVIALEWIDEAHDSLNDWIASPRIDEALDIIKTRTMSYGRAKSDAYWARIERYVSSSPTFEVGDGYVTDVADVSVRSTVAAMLHAVATRPADKSLEGFYNFYDPFYFNGPIFNTATLGEMFDLATPLGGHLLWETNPQHFSFYAEQYLPADMAGPIKLVNPESPKKPYRKVKRTPEYFNAFMYEATPGLREMAANIVKDCSSEAHGDINATHDFELSPARHLNVATRYVATALRSSITALRLEARYTGTDEQGRANIVCRISNLADEPAKLLHVSVFRRYEDGTLSMSPIHWFKAEGKKIKSSKVHKARLRIKLPEDVDPLSLVIDVRAEYKETPDIGWRRADVVDRELSVITNPDADHWLSENSGPTDVIIVMDTTSSMGSALADLKADAYTAVTNLKERTPDLRVALVTFKDLEADKDGFDVYPFTSEISDLKGWFAGYSPKGGGDLPEDQLHGLSLAIKLWEDEPTSSRIPTKVIIVITDAAAKKPDTAGNTPDSIAERAFNVDPAHIYPIVVGSNAEALADAELLAELTNGEVLTSESGDDVSVLLARATESAIATHGAPDDSEPIPPNALWTFVGGSLLFVSGGIVTLKSLLAARG